MDNNLLIASIKELKEQFGNKAKANFFNILTKYTCDMHKYGLSSKNYHSDYFYSMTDEIMMALDELGVQCYKVRLNHLAETLEEHLHLLNQNNKNRTADFDFEMLDEINNVKIVLDNFADEDNENIKSSLFNEDWENLNELTYEQLMNEINIHLQIE